MLAESFRRILFLSFKDRRKNTILFNVMLAKKELEENEILNDYWKRVSLI